MTGRIANRVGRRYPMGFRTTSEIRARLEAAANESGRSLTQEIEHRLEASFLMGDLRTVIREVMAERDTFQLVRVLSFDKRVDHNDTADKAA
jgi:hypothetical protein